MLVPKVIARISNSKVVAGVAANDEVVCVFFLSTERMYAIFFTITTDIIDF